MEMDRRALGAFFVLPFFLYGCFLTKASKARTVSILSIEAQGVENIIPFILLEEIEKKTGKPVLELFDIISSTSTSSMAALGLASGKNKITASSLKNFYREESKKIYSSTLWDKFLYAIGYNKTKYQDDQLKKSMAELLGDEELKEAKTNVVIAAFNLDFQEPYIFRSDKAKRDADKNYYIKDVAAAASALPGLFEPQTLKSLGIEAHSLNDHVTFLNPTVLALDVAQEIYHDIDRYIIVDLSVSRTSLDNEIFKKDGMVDATKIRNFQRQTAHDEFVRKLPKIGGKKQYFSFSAQLPEFRYAVDDTSPYALEHLQAVGERLTQVKKKQDFIDVTGVLVEYYNSKNISTNSPEEEVHGKL